MKEENFDVKSEPLFFPFPISRLIVFSVLSLNLFQIYWFYKNWAYVKKKEGSNIKPGWRGFFAIIFCYPLFKRIENLTSQRGMPETIFPGPMACLYIALSLHVFVVLLSVLVLVPVQKAINELNNL